MRLNELAPGGVGRVAGLETEGTMRRRLLELGLVPGTGVKCLGRSLSLIQISEPTRLRRIPYAVFCLKNKNKR